MSNKLKETTLRKYRCTAVAAGSIHKLTQWYYIGNEQEMEKQQVSKLFFNYTWDLALITLRNSYLFGITLLTVLDSEKFKSDGFFLFSYILTVILECSLRLHATWNSNQHFLEEKKKSLCAECVMACLSPNHTVLSALSSVQIKCSMVLAKNKTQKRNGCSIMGVSRSFSHCRF